MTPTPKQQLDAFVRRFTPAIATLTGNALAKMRTLTPGALAIGFCPTERAGDGIFPSRSIRASSGSSSFRGSDFPIRRDGWREMEAWSAASRSTT